MRRSSSGMLRDLRNRVGDGERRQPESECRALLPAPLGRDAASMRGGDLLDDGEPEAAATNAIGAAAAIEGLEEVRQIARGDSRAAIFDTNDDASLVGRRADGNPLARGAVADRVGD